MLKLLTEVNAAATSEYESAIFIAIYNSSGMWYSMHADT